MNNSQDIQQQLQSLEETVEEIHRRLAQQRTVLKNTEKKLQEFQDTIYAMLIDERYAPRRKFFSAQHDQEESVEL